MAKWKGKQWRGYVEQRKDVENKKLNIFVY